jgi:hypothetical protein
MSFIVVTETAAESKEARYRNLPAHYPVSIKEYGTREEAELAWPGSKVATRAEYLEFKEAMNKFTGAILHEDHRDRQTRGLVVAGTGKRKWWRFW